jgi:hypothetical protein
MLSAPEVRAGIVILKRFLMSAGCDDDHTWSSISMLLANSMTCSHYYSTFARHDTWRYA